MRATAKIFFAAFLALWPAFLLNGCRHFALLDPQGPIGATERFVILVASALMLIVVIPVIIMALVFPQKYRASNTHAVYRPQWYRSGRIEAVVWLIPAAIVAVLATLIWIKTYQLDPYRPIEAQVAPLTIEAVSLDWKWLFIYPEQNIATVNELVFPVAVPLRFRLTSASVMTSFFIPRLGSQIYAMAGMQTQLHLLADRPGVFDGQNQQFSGRGYADMHFKARAVSQAEFTNWAQGVRQSADKLDLTRYQDLAKPAVDYPVTHFSPVSAGLFEHILQQYDVHPAGSLQAVGASGGN